MENDQKITGVDVDAENAALKQQVAEILAQKGELESHVSLLMENRDKAAAEKADVEAKLDAALKELDFLKSEAESDVKPLVAAIDAEMGVADVPYHVAGLLSGIRQTAVELALKLNGFYAAANGHSMLPDEPLAKMSNDMKAVMNNVKKAL